MSSPQPQSNEQKDGMPMSGTGHIVAADGAPTPTIVLDRRDFPRDTEGLLAALTAVRVELAAGGRADVLKNALIEPSSNPMFDLDYTFVQSLPAAPDAYDLRGSCGHSILASVEAAARDGLIGPLRPGLRVRVNVVNNADTVVCEVEHSDESGSSFTAHFLCTPPIPRQALVMTGEATTSMVISGRPVEVSLVSMSNPYAFVSGPDLGVTTAAELFGAGEGLYGTMTEIHRAACRVLGWDPSGAFPKVAVLVSDEGRLAVRAVSVPTWHPTLALTGAVCLGAAVGVEGAVPWRAAQQAGHRDGQLTILTPASTVRVAATSIHHGPQAQLAWVSVGNKSVAYQGGAAVSPPFAAGRQVA